jgi:hypothetical protein
MHSPDKDKGLNAPDAGVVTPSQAHPELGYEASDINTRSVLVFLISLSAFIVVFFIFVFGMGKVINTELVKHDGPPSKWNQATAAPHERGKSMQSTAAMEQQQFQLMTERFPSPRVQRDDGDQDMADMHQKEDLLLDHYTWVDQQQGVVRIPIERAMELIVEKGLPVAPAAATSAGTDTAVITPPLTNGFARTTFEQEQSTRESLMGQRHEAASNKAPGKTENAKVVAKAQAGGIQ